MTAEQRHIGGGFNDSAQREQSALRLFERICAKRPDLKDKPFVVPKYGMQGLVMLFEDEVFKSYGPVRPGYEGFEKQNRETGMLKKMEGHGFPVPKVTTIDENFYGQTRIHGVPLDREILGTMRERETQDLAAEIANFILKMPKYFSREEVSEYAPKGVEHRDVNAREALALPAVKQQLGNNYDMVRRNIEDYLVRYAAKPEIFFHADLNVGNILVYPKVNRLAGIIDFGIVDRGPPEGAFLAISGNYGPRFCQYVLDAYKNQSGHDVTYKDIVCLHLVYALANTLFSLHENPRSALKHWAGELAKMEGEGAIPAVKERRAAP